MNYIDKIIGFYKKNFKNISFRNHSPIIDKSELIELEKCIKSTFVSTVGNQNEIFIKELNKIIKSKYLIPVNSGTSALHLSLISCGIGKTNEVLVPSLSFVASANAILYSQATPHFIDVSEKTLAVDFDNLENYLKKFKLRNGHLYNQFTKKKIKAMIVVHTFGYAADMTKAKKIAKKYNLFLIEDAAESIGSYYKKKHTGTFGDIGIISFNGNKTITTGAGGVIITGNKKLYNKALSYSKVSKINKPYFLEFEDIGYNYRMPNLNASIGISQLKKINFILSLKKKLHKKYRKFFNDFDKITLHKESVNTKSNHWLNTIIIKDNNFNYKKQINLLSKLNNKKIELRPMWKPLHKLKYLEKFPRMKMENTNYLELRLFKLPSSPEIMLNEKK